MIRGLASLLLVLVVVTHYAYEPLAEALLHNLLCPANPS